MHEYHMQNTFNKVFIHVCLGQHLMGVTDTGC